MALWTLFKLKPINHWKISYQVTDNASKIQFFSVLAEALLAPSVNLINFSWE